MACKGRLVHRARHDSTDCSRFRAAGDFGFPFLAAAGIEDSQSKV